MSKRRRKRTRRRCKCTPAPSSSVCSSDPSYFSIYESELRFIAGTSLAWPDLETGGHLYGLWTAGGRAVVGFATGPSPDATHQATHFAQDVEYFRRITRELHEDYGLQLVGPWHSHHRLALNKPSPGDDETTKSLSRRNNLTRLVEILINHEAPPVASTSIWGLGRASRLGKSKTADRIGWRGTKSEPGRDALVRVNSFHHDNPQAAAYQRCPIRVIPGISPIRLKMITQGLIDGGIQLHSQISFPMSRIRFDSADPPAARSKNGDPELEVPTSLAAQLADIPASIRKNVTAVVADGIIVFEFPGCGSASIQVACDKKPPHGIRAVCRKSQVDGQLVDITTTTLQGDSGTTLGEVLQKVMERMNDKRVGPLTGDSVLDRVARIEPNGPRTPNPNLGSYCCRYGQL